MVITYILVNHPFCRKNNDSTIARVVMMDLYGLLNNTEKGICVLRCPTLRGKHPRAVSQMAMVRAIFAPRTCENLECT